MRRMDFTTEHVESFQPGETYEVTECVLPSSYYYVLEHALGISCLLYTSPSPRD